MGNPVNVWVKVIIQGREGINFNVQLARVPCIGEHLTFNPDDKVYEVVGVEHCAWMPREAWSAAILIKEIDQ